MFSDFQNGCILESQLTMIIKRKRTYLAIIYDMTGPSASAAGILIRTRHWVPSFFVSIGKCGIHLVG